jgi:2-methylcitrate dehydratase PrpD
VSAGETLARRLAGECGALRDGRLAPEVAARATALLRDYLGVTVGGAGVESSVVLRRGLRTLDPGGRATVLGTPERLSVAGAALANGAAAHALEMDDTHQAGSIHLGATVFSAALAAAELRGADGSTVLRAAVAGYEVAGRLACALDPAAHYRRGFHPTGTCGAFGAAAAAGVVFGLDDAALASALGIAGSQAAGSMEFLADGAWTKRLHPGWAAAAGLHAAALAEAGFRAPASVFEGRFGVLAAYSDGADPRALQGGHGWALCATSVKPHACCRYMQGPIDATLALRARERLTPEGVARVEVGMLAAGMPIVCEPAAAKRRPTSVVDAQFSLPFGIAVALVRGAASPAEFTPETCADPSVRALMDRVVAVPDPALDARYPAAWPSWVRIVLSGGRTVESRVDHPRGDPENFPSAAELDAKFRTLAARALAPAAVARLAGEIDAFPEAPNVVSLLAAAASTVS